MSNIMAVRSHHHTSLEHFERNSLVLPERQKSPSISIKADARSEESNFQMENANERMYDSATWRMYHRITNARRARNATTTGGRKRTDSPNERRRVPHARSATPQLQKEYGTPATDQEDYELEMFEMDL